MSTRDDRPQEHEHRRFDADGSGDDGGLVGRLVGLADVGPEPPAGGADAVREAVRPVWRAEVRARSRRRLVRGAVAMTAAAAVVAVAVVVGLRRPEPAVAPPAGRLAVALGPVLVVTGDGERLQITAADGGLELPVGATLETGSSGGATIELAGGESLRVDAGSELAIESAVELDLVSGGVYIDSEDVSGPGVRVRTALGVTRDIGTQFEVRSEDGSVTVRVRSGSVALDLGAEVIEIPRGTAVRVAEDGSRQAEPVAAFDESWDWAQHLAPAFEMEGRTAAELLDWVSRETGLWISFQSTDAEKTAFGAVLHGSLEGVAPSEAAALVLPGCGLEAVPGAGSLTVRLAAGGGGRDAPVPDVSPPG